MQKVILNNSIEMPILGFGLFQVTDPSAFKPIASANVLEIATNLAEQEKYGDQNWAALALADGKLLIRDQTRLFCVKVAQ